MRCRGRTALPRRRPRPGPHPRGLRDPPPRAQPLEQWQPGLDSDQQLHRDWRSGRSRGTGLRASWRGGRAGTWTPLLLGIYGACLIGAGIFVADPGAGFPPGTPDPPPFSQEYALTRSGILHFVFGGIGFYAFVGACLVAARRFWGRDERLWALSTVAIGVGFFASFMMMIWRPFPEFLLAFWVAVLLMWVWHTAFYLHVRQEPVLRDGAISAPASGPRGR